MRTFKYASKTRFPNSYYNCRMSCEWDINVQVSEQWPTSKVIEALQECSDFLVYGLVGGVEFSTRDDNHVHIALIFRFEVSKRDVLSYLKNPPGQKYAAPRNKKWPYCGWKIHHCKTETKVESESDKHILWEMGKLPVDSDETLLENENFLVGFIKRHPVDKNIFNTDTILKRIAHAKVNRKFDGAVSTFNNPSEYERPVAIADEALNDETKS